MEDEEDSSIGPQLWSIHRIQVRNEIRGPDQLHQVLHQWLYQKCQDATRANDWKELRGACLSGFQESHSCTRVERASLKTRHCACCSQVSAPASLSLGEYQEFPGDVAIVRRVTRAFVVAMLGRHWEETATMQSPQVNGREGVQAREQAWHPAKGRYEQALRQARSAVSARAPAVAARRRA